MMFFFCVVWAAISQLAVDTILGSSSPSGF